MSPPKSPNLPRGQQSRIVYSTTDGRQHFPDILQGTYGDKSVIGFDRYGRALGAVVPVEAVFMLAGQADTIDEDVRARIRRAANALLSELGREETDLGLVSVDDVKRSRSSASHSASSRKKRSAG